MQRPPNKITDSGRVGGFWWAVGAAPEIRIRKWRDEGKKKSDGRTNKAPCTQKNRGCSGNSLCCRRQHPALHQSELANPRGFSTPSFSPPTSGLQLPSPSVLCISHQSTTSSQRSRLRFDSLSLYDALTPDRSYLGIHNQAS
jgi:hypothetical protein